MAAPRSRSYTTAVGQALLAGAYAQSSGTLAISAAIDELASALSLSVALATALTLSVPPVGVTGSPSAVQVSINGPAPPGGVIATLARSGAATGSLIPNTLSWAPGETGTKTATINNSSDGQSVVTLTNNAGLLNNGSGSTFTTTASGFAFTFIDDATIILNANTTTTLANGTPGGAISRVDPDLPNDVVLQQVGGALYAVGGPNVPSVDPASPDAVIAAIANRSRIVEVMDSPMATIRNATKDITYDYVAPGSFWAQYDGQTQNRWNAVWGQMDAGDVIEISPGAVHAVDQDASHYYSNSLDSCGLHISKGGTFKSMTNRGRWRVWPAGFNTGNRNALGIFSPGDTGARADVTLEGFDITDQFSTNGAGVRIRSAAMADGVWTGHNLSVTLRNFKIGRTTGRSLSGVSGMAELVTLDNGDIFDCGNGTGQEHNIYSGARVFVMTGVRTRRSRGWTSAPVTYTEWGNLYYLEGHMAKLSAVTGTIEGCSFDCDALGDPSLLLQMKAGGNWAIRGNLFRDTRYPKNAQGMINMCREYASDGVTPNFEWWAGSLGNSIDFQRNLIFGHYPRPIFFFFPQDSSRVGEPMRPAAGGAWAAEQRLSALTVVDNIAMVTPTNWTGTYDWSLAGFPGASNAMWINLDPNAGANWGARGNTALAYGSAEPGFSANEKALLLSRLGASAPAASGSLTTKRFVPPHGWISRTDSLRGLG